MATPDLFPEELPIRRPMARREDPRTSKESAGVIEPELGSIQRAVLEAFHRRGPMTARTAEKLPEFSDYGYSTIRKRISELYRGGRLREVGVDRAGRAPAMIYGVSS